MPILIQKPMPNGSAMGSRLEQMVGQIDRSIDRFQVYAPTSLSPIFLCRVSFQKHVEPYELYCTSTRVQYILTLQYTVSYCCSSTCGTCTVESSCNTSFTALLHVSTQWTTIYSSTCGCLSLLESNILIHDIHYCEPYCSTRQHT